MNHYEQFVAERVKSPQKIIDTLTPAKADLLHAAMGISGEAGELLDAIKKHVIYNKDLDLNNVLEELGDLEFYMAAMRQRLGVLRGEILTRNVSKLIKRYPSGYTDQAAKDRADKQAETGDEQKGN